MDIGTQIWTALIQDPRTQTDSRLIRVLQPIVNKIPTKFAASWDQTVTAVSLEEMRVKFMKFCLEEGVVRAVAITFPPESFNYDGFEATVKNKEGELLQLIIRNERYLEALPKAMLQKGLSDADLVLSPAVGLNRNMVTRYLDGTLTIGQLLLEQPYFIIRDGLLA